jgi:SAM-dependent methyltransferase
VEREEVFDEDYLYFYETFLTDERSEQEAELVWELVGLSPGAEVLDLACGHGRIANRLAERGARVTGLDATPLFLERARADAAVRGVEVEYVEGDMRELPWEERFDAVLSWFTSFGYFDDDDNRRVLREAHKALKPGGELLIDNNNLFAFARAQGVDVVERDGNFLIDRFRLDPRTSRSHTARVVMRDGRTRRFEFELRLFTASELADWLRAAGFRDPSARSRDSEELTVESWRMVTIARKGSGGPP